MSPYGKAKHGKTEMRKEISLIGMAHRTSFILQSSAAHTTHLLEGFIDGFNSRHPALFNIYAACPVEHGIADDMARHQSRLAVDSRAYPLFRYDPDAGTSYEDCASLEGNAKLTEDWLTYPVKYLDEDGEQKSMELPFTFADFAMTEGRFSKHFRKVPESAWNDELAASAVPLHEFLEMDNSDREGLFPYVMATDSKNHLVRVLVAEEMVNSCDERRHFWRQLRSLTGVENQAQVKAAAAAAKAELASQLTGKIEELVGTITVSQTASPAIAAPAEQGDNLIPTVQVGEGVWVESAECTACDECINIAPGVFAYDSDGKVKITNHRELLLRILSRRLRSVLRAVFTPVSHGIRMKRIWISWIKRAEKFQ